MKKKSTEDIIFDISFKIFKTLGFFIIYASLIALFIGSCIGLVTKGIAFLIPIVLSITVLSGIICVHISTIKMDRWLEE